MDYFIPPYVSLLKACTMLQDLETIYTKCDFFAEALNVFKRLPLQNIVSWKTLVSGYARNERGEDALICHSRMDSKGISLNVVAFVWGLKTCGSI